MIALICKIACIILMLAIAYKIYQNSKLPDDPIPLPKDNFIDMESQMVDFSNVNYKTSSTNLQDTLATLDNKDLSDLYPSVNFEELEPRVMAAEAKAFKKNKNKRGKRRGKKH